MTTEFYTVQQVADQLSVHHKTVRAWIDSGKLGAVRVGKLYRIPADALSLFTQQEGEVSEGVASPGLELLEKATALAEKLDEAYSMARTIESGLTEAEKQVTVAV